MDAVIARVVRGGMVESVHRGALVLHDAAGRTVLARGDVDGILLPRSALKPLQAVAMLHAGLDLDGELLALAAASHAGEPAHREGVGRILASAGLDASALENTPDLPLDPDEAARFRAGGVGPSPVAQNCSGKHAAMLATCVAAGWPTDGYRDPEHPLQQAVRATSTTLTGVAPGPPLVDGCGAPLFTTTLAGLARAFARLALAPPAGAEGRVASAVRAHPWWLGGSARPVTRLLAAVPGLVAKDGAEGVFAAALPDGRALALKVADGSARPVPALVAAGLDRLGARSVELAEAGRVDVLGHGTAVGRVEPVLS